MRFPGDGHTESVVHSILHAAGVFFDHLAAVQWDWLGLALGCHLCKLASVSRAWRNIVAAAYPDSLVSWRRLFGAYVAGTGVNAIVPARGGEAVKLYIAKHRVDDSTYTTLFSTVLLQTMFDMVVAGGFILWAIALGVLPGLNVLPNLPSFDWAWAFRHPTAGWILLSLLVVFSVALLIWIADRVEEFWQRVARGFAVLSDRRRYVRTVVVWQVADWSLRLATVFCFLHAFNVPATFHNALLVQVSQSLATVFPFSPAGIGTEQALLVYVLRGAASRTALLSFSVGMRLTLIVFNAVLGFTAILLMLGTVRFRRLVDRAAAERA
jgi:uncharacterized membrane protein YbhN (UPF0104 family)